MKSLKTKLLFKINFLFAGFLIPLGPSSQWHEFNFLSEMPNKVSFSKSSLDISVDQSASPLIYVFKKPVNLKSLQVQFNVKGFPKSLPRNVTQGFKGSDDFLLRVGLIYRGKKRMNWLQRQLAPSWLVGMEKLLPEGMGVDKVHFISTCRDPKILNKLKKHFLDSTMMAECTSFVEDRNNPLIAEKLNGKSIEIFKSFEAPPEVLGLWIASDGDDLKSRFQIQITKLKIN